MQHDVARPEDIDTDGEDHAGDEWRYACMSRPYIVSAPPKPKPMTLRQPTLNELVALTEQRAGTRIARI